MPAPSSPQSTPRVPWVFAHRMVMIAVALLMLFGCIVAFVLAGANLRRGLFGVLKPSVPVVTNQVAPSILLPVIPAASSTMVDAALAMATTTLIDIPAAVSSTTPTILFQEWVEEVVHPSDAILYETPISRWWLNIWRKQGTGKSEQLASLDFGLGWPGVGSTYFIPQRQEVIAVYGKHVQRVNIETRQTTTVSLSARRIQGSVLSPDKKKLFLWEKEKAIEYMEVPYSFTVISLEDGQSEMVRAGTSPESYYPMVWRSDDKIVLLSEASEMADEVWYFDLQTKRLEQSEAYYLSIISNDGSVMAVADAWIQNPCELPSYAQPSHFSVIDPITSAVLGRFGDPKKEQQAEVLALSTSTQQALYASWGPLQGADPDDEHLDEKCAVESAKKVYWKESYKTGIRERVVDVGRVLTEWGQPISRARVRSASPLSTLVLDGKPVAQARSLDVIAEYE